MNGQSPSIGGRQRRLVLFVDRQIVRLTHHWLAALNLLIGGYLLLPILAPVLMANGAEQAGRMIYVLYAPACHQLPQRSFFLYGPQLTYTLDELWALGEVNSNNPLVLKQYLGSPQVGFKMAMCARDIALYGGLLIGGLLFGILRKHIRPISLLVYALFLLPLVVDGGTQLIGWRESTWVLRLITGLIAGLGTIWLLYPHVEDAFKEIRWQAEGQIDKAQQPSKPQSVD